MKPLIGPFGSYLSRGGYLMWPLLACTVILAYALVYRWAILRRRRGVLGQSALIFQAILKEPSPSLQARFDLAAAEAGAAASRFKTLSRTIVIIAPLAGLLGTVAGMIVMFESLEQQVFLSHSGGVAGGISQALFTTQLGLTIAVPGMIAGRLLERKERSVLEEIDRFRSSALRQSGEAAGE